MELTVLTKSEVIEFLQCSDLTTLEGMQDDEIEEAIDGWIEHMADYNVGRKMEFPMTHDTADLATMKELGEAQRVKDG